MFCWRLFCGLQSHLCRKLCQTFAVKVEVDEGEVRAEPVMVLRDASVSHLVEAEDKLRDAEDMFNLGSYFRFRRIFLLRTSST